MKADALKLVIFGVGLIGGSFSLALKKAGMVREAVGFGRSEKTLEEAKKLGIIDRTGTDEDLKDTDIVLLAVPVGQMEDILKRISPLLGRCALVTDAGSTKGDVAKLAQFLGAKSAQFVPAHPIAGGEKSGPSAATADLFEGRKVVLTPLPENPAASVERARKTWETCGASVAEMSPEEHDEVFAAVSHLPHLLSFALVHDIASRENRDLLLSHAASGFRDFTRIAASSPEMWRDICLANRDALIIELDRYMKELDVIRGALQDKDAERLEKIFSKARSIRSGWEPG